MLPFTMATSWVYIYIYVSMATAKGDHVTLVYGACVSIVLVFQILILGTTIYLKVHYFVIPDVYTFDFTNVDI